MSACQISEEFIHGPLSEDIQVRLEREKLVVNFVYSVKTNNSSLIELNYQLKKQCAVDSNQVTRLDSQTSDQLVFETDNEYLLNCFQVDSLRNIIQVIFLERLLSDYTILYIYTIFTKI